MILRLTLLILAAAVLAGCTGVIDRCTQGFDPPPGGWTGRR